MSSQRKRIRPSLIFLGIFFIHQTICASDAGGEQKFLSLIKDMQELSINQEKASSDGYEAVFSYSKVLAQETENTLRERVADGAKAHSYLLKKRAILTLFFITEGSFTLYGAYRAVYDNCVEQNCNAIINRAANPQFSYLAGRAGGGAVGGSIGGLVGVIGTLYNGICGLSTWIEGDKTYNRIPLANLIKSSIIIYELKPSIDIAGDTILPAEDLAVIKDTLVQYYKNQSEKYSHTNLNDLSSSIKLDTEQVMKIAERVYWAACRGPFLIEWENLSPVQVIEKILNDADYFVAVNPKLESILNEHAHDQMRILILEEKAKSDN